MKRIAFVIAAVMLAAGGPAAQDLERLFKAAVNTETVDRNLRAAIEQYRKVAGGSNRVLAAQALVRMAECYQQLGDAEAQRVYERIVRDFSDQADAVAVARARLSGRTTLRPAGNRIVKSGPDATWGDGRVSPDGRFISFVTYAGPKGLNLMLHNLATGTDRPITDVDWNGGAAYDSTFSPDGKQLAYGWRTYGPPAHVNELRVVALEPSGLPRPRTLYTNDEIENFSPTDWSNDGTTLAVRVRRKDRTNQIALIGIDGSFRALKTVEGWRSVNKIFFSPDGRHLAYDMPASDTDQRRDLFIIAADASSGVPVHDPADDVVMGWSRDGRHLLFASDRNGDVSLWGLPVSNGRPNGAPVLLKRELGTVLSQGLTSAGALYVVKDASTINVQVAPIDLERGTLTGPPVVQIFRSEPPAWSPDGKKLAYAARGANGQMFLAIRSVETNQVRELRPQLSYMPHPRWFPDGQSVVVWGRSLKGDGLIKKIDVETGHETFITAANDIQAAHVSPDGRKLYYHVDYFSGSVRPGRLIERDLETGAERDVVRQSERERQLPGGGAPVISQNGQSVVRVQVDRKTRSSTFTVSPTAGGEPRAVTISAIVASRAPAWTPGRQALLVVSDADPIRKSPQALWVVPVNGGAPRKLDIDVSTWIGDVRLSPDGRHIAYFTGKDRREIWALEDFLPAR